MPGTWVAGREAAAPPAQVENPFGRLRTGLCHQNGDGLGRIAFACECSDFGTEASASVGMTEGGFGSPSCALRTSLLPKQQGDGRRGSVSPPYRAANGRREGASAASCRSNEGVAMVALQWQEASSCRTGVAGGKWLSPSGRHPGRRGGLGAPAEQGVAGGKWLSPSGRHPGRHGGLGAPAEQEKRRRGWGWKDIGATEGRFAW